MIENDLDMCLCSSNQDIIKKGKTESGLQRYFCKSCKKTFTKKTIPHYIKTFILTRSKKSSLQQAADFVNKILSKAGSNNRIGRSAIYYWRENRDEILKNVDIMEEIVFFYEQVQKIYDYSPPPELDLPEMKVYRKFITHKYEGILWDSEENTTKKNDTRKKRKNNIRILQCIYGYKPTKKLASHREELFNEIVKANGFSDDVIKKVKDYDEDLYHLLKENTYKERKYEGKEKRFQSGKCEDFEKASKELLEEKMREIWYIS